jgi:hypothetical protein
MVVMVVMMAVDPTRDPDHDTAVVMMVVTEGAMMVMMMMADADIELRHFHLGFIACRSRGGSRVGRPQCREGVRDRIEQLGKRLGRQHATGVLHGRRGRLRAADRGQSRDCADDTDNCSFHGGFTSGLIALR